ncbi:hypothetical protein SAMD00023353_2601280 [Rosellinia necatrix]|uniref:Uncharacterized protein n=1 Tax=Rosellinia necatrix TaxID=77044 RepID=A0A1S8A8H9_ROSNE|nr:hypothetical protein SAMD00023353_2601280 [Rosellinia necatrix]
MSDHSASTCTVVQIPWGFQDMVVDKSLECTTDRCGPRLGLVTVTFPVTTRSSGGCSANIGIIADVKGSAANFDGDLGATKGLDVGVLTAAQLIHCADP